MVLDYNILNRATFDDRQLQHEVVLQPHIYESGNVLEFGQNNVFWIKSIDWRFTYKDVGIINRLTRPLQNVEVSVGDIIINVSEPRPAFIQPIPALERLTFRVRNTNLANNMQLIVKFKLDGTLVTPKPGSGALSHKEALGFIMLGPDKKGELTLGEAVVDAIEEQRRQKGLSGLREKLPGGMGLGAIAAMPQLKSLMMGITPENGHLALENETTTTQLKRLALDADPKKDKSAFVGDFITGCPPSFHVVNEELQLIAEHMIQQGWRKLT